MTKETITKPNIAIIGLGNIGQELATNLIRGGRSILLSDRNLQKAHDFSEKLGSSASPMEIAAAMKAADIIIMAVCFEAIKALMHQYALALQKKIIMTLPAPSHRMAKEILRKPLMKRHLQVSYWRHCCRRMQNL